MKPSGAHTHPEMGGGGGFEPILGLIGVIVLAAAVAGPVIAAVAELVRIVLIAVAVVGGLALAATAAAVACRVRQGRAIGTTCVSFP